jgi:hypothetical protein
MSSSSKTTRFRAFAVTAACVAALGFAACGDDDEETSTTAPVAEETTTETSGDTGELDTADAGALRDQFNQQLITVLTEQQNLTEAQAQCAIEELESTVSDDELQAAILEAAESGEAPQDLIDAGFDAGQACADAE